MFTALDRSGTSDLSGTNPRHDPFVTGLVGILPEALEGFNEAFHRLKRQCYSAAYREVKGRNCSEEAQSAFIHLAMSSGRIGVLSISKTETRKIRPVESLPSSAEFLVISALHLLREFFVLSPVKTLWCDEDIQGRAQRQKFNTLTEQLYRSTRPSESIRVRHKRSHTSELIQLADVIAYSFGKEARGAIETKEPSDGLKKLRNDPRHVIMGPEAWRG